jgi:hypothetical protein
MTAKEAFEMLEKCGTNTEQPYEDMILEALYQALTELEELKKDIKKYFEMVEKNMSYVFLGSEEENDKFDNLEEKIS